MSSTPIFNPGTGSSSANTVTGNFTVTGNTELKENLLVLGNETINGNLTVYGTISSGGGGGTGVFGSLSVSGDSQLGTIGSAGNTKTSHNTLDDGTGNASFAGNVEVSGHFVNSTGSAIALPAVAGTLALTSQLPTGTVVTTTTLNNNTLPASLTSLSVSGSSSLGGLSAGATSLSSAAISGTLSAGSSTLSSALVLGSITVGGNATITSGGTASITLPVGTGTLAFAPTSGTVVTTTTLDNNTLPASFTNLTVSGSASAGSISTAGTLNAGASTLASADVIGSLVTSHNSLDDGAGNVTISGGITQNVAGTGNNFSMSAFLEPSMATGSVVGVQIGKSVGATGAIFDSALLSYDNNGGNNSTSNTANLSVYGGPSIGVDGNGYLKMNNNTTILPASSTANITLPSGTGTLAFAPTSGSYVTTTTINNNTLPASFTTLAVSGSASAGTLSAGASTLASATVSGTLSAGATTLASASVTGNGVVHGSLTTTNNILDDGNGNIQTGGTGGNISANGLLRAAGTDVGPPVGYNVITLGGEDTNSRPFVQAYAGNTVVALDLNPRGGGTHTQYNTLDDGYGNVSLSGYAYSPTGFFSPNIGGEPNVTSLNLWYPGNNDSQLYAYGNIRLHAGSTQGQATNTVLIEPGAVVVNGNLSVTGTTGPNAVITGTSNGIVGGQLEIVDTRNSGNQILYIGSTSTSATTGYSYIQAQSGTSSPTYDTLELNPNGGNVLVSGNFVLNNTTLQGSSSAGTITFPAGSGTVALTSQLPAVLPHVVAGGTAGSESIFSTTNAGIVTVNSSDVYTFTTAAKWKMVVNAAGTSTASAGANGVLNLTTGGGATVFSGQLGYFTSTGVGNAASTVSSLLFTSAVGSTVTLSPTNFTLGQLVVDIQQLP